MAQDLWNAKRLHPVAALKRINQFRLKEEGQIVSQDLEVRVKHKTCSTICGTPVQAILDQESLTRLAGGGQGRSKCGQECTSNNNRNGLNLSLEPSRGP